MSAQAVGQTQGRFKIDGSPAGCLGPERCAIQGFLTHVGQESIAHTVRHREADPVHGDAVTELERRERCTAADQQSLAAELDLTNRLHQPREHRFPPVAVPLAIIGQGTAGPWLKCTSPGSPLTRPAAVRSCC